MKAIPTRRLEHLRARYTTHARIYVQLKRVTLRSAMAISVAKKARENQRSTGHTGVSGFFNGFPITRPQTFFTTHGYFQIS